MVVPKRESKQSPRSPVGTRVEFFMSLGGSRQKSLANAIGMGASEFNDRLAGRKQFSISTLKAIAENLGNCTIAELLSQHIPPRCIAIEDRFILALSEVTGEPWIVFAGTDWGSRLSVECYWSLREHIDDLLFAAAGFTAGVDFTGIKPVLSQVITFLERVYSIDPASPVAEHLADACDRLARAVLMTEDATKMIANVGPIVRLMGQLSEQTKSRDLALRTLAVEGDMFNVYAGHDPKGFAVAYDRLQRITGQADIRHKGGYYFPRGLVRAAARTAKTEGEFEASIRVAEEALDGDWLLIEEKRHVLDGLGEALAVRRSTTGGSNEYLLRAIKSYERASALPFPLEPTEFVVRLKRLPLILADLGIRDLISKDGRELEEVERMAWALKSNRVAAQVHALGLRLQKQGIIKV